MHTSVPVYNRTHVDVRRQFAYIGSLLQLCGLWGAKLEWFSSKCHYLPDPTPKKM